MNPHHQLSRRERQIMDAVYVRGQASAREVLEGLPDPPTRTAVRTMLRILEDKGLLRHGKRGREFVYHPTRPRQQAGQSALRSVLKVFFDDSLPAALAAHLSDPRARLSETELKRLSELVRQARERGA